MKKYLPVTLLAAGLLMAFNKPVTGLIAPGKFKNGNLPASGYNAFCV